MDFKTKNPKIPGTPNVPPELSDKIFIDLIKKILSIVFNIGDGYGHDSFLAEHFRKIYGIERDTSYHEMIFKDNKKIDHLSTSHNIRNKELGCELITDPTKLLISINLKIEPDISHVAQYIPQINMISMELPYGIYSIIHSDENNSFVLALLEESKENEEALNKYELIMSTIKNKIDSVIKDIYYSVVHEFMHFLQWNTRKHISLPVKAKYLMQSYPNEKEMYQNIEDYKSKYYSHPYEIKPQLVSQIYYYEERFDLITPNSLNLEIFKRIEKQRRLKKGINEDPTIDDLKDIIFKVMTGTEDNSIYEVEINEMGLRYYDLWMRSSEEFKNSHQGELVMNILDCLKTLSNKLRIGEFFKYLKKYDRENWKRAVSDFYSIVKTKNYGLDDSEYNLLNSIIKNNS